MIDLVAMQKEFDKQLNIIAAKLPKDEQIKFNSLRSELKGIIIDNKLSFEMKQAKILEIQRKYGY